MRLTTTYFAVTFNRKSPLRMWKRRLDRPFWQPRRNGRRKTKAESPQHLMTLVKGKGVEEVGSPSNPVVVGRQTHPRTTLCQFAVVHDLAIRS